MKGEKYYFLKNNKDYEIIEVEDCKHGSVYKKEDLFLYLVDECNLTYLEIWNIFLKNEIIFERGNMIEYHILNSDRFSNLEGELSIKIKMSKGFIYDIVLILPKHESSQKPIKGVSLTLNVKREFLPFYLCVFLKDYCIEKYYPSIKNLLGDSRAISFLNLYNHVGEYYLVKNRDKVVYIATTKKIADYYINIIQNIRKDDSRYFIPSIEIISGFKNLFNYLNKNNPNITVNSIKNMVDFLSFDLDSDSKDFIIKDKIASGYIIKTKENDYVLRDDIDKIYDFIIENNLGDPSFLAVDEINTMMSNDEVFKSIYLSNKLDNVKLEELNGLSIFDISNFLKINSNVISLALSDKLYNPKLLIYNNLLNNSVEVLFFTNEYNMKLFIEREDIVVLFVGDLSLDSIRNKIIEKNLELFAYDDNFSFLEYAINLVHIYKNSDSPKMKHLKDIGVIIDVDASLNLEGASCGIVLRDSSNKILTKISRDVVASTNVEAEINGVMYAIKYALMEGFSEICIRYDYIGIFEYLVGENSNEIATRYKEFFSNIVKDNDIDIYFKKVRAHSDDEYNDMAHYLANNLR